ncbi:YcaO-like family protein [Enterococcus faecalis]|uniref:YcaO-like family protein n=1 Tax=Enterococcus faecalis TaxID=1351 RepID=UPI002FBEBD4B
MKINIINHRKICEPFRFEIDDYKNYKEMVDYLGYFNLIKKIDLVLSPSNELSLFIGNTQFTSIDYLLNYILGKTSMSENISTSVFAGGKGFSMYKAICSSFGEAFERFVGIFEFFEIKKELVYGSYKDLKKRNINMVHPKQLQNFIPEDFESDTFLFDKFTEDTKISWVKGEYYFSGKEVYFPAALMLIYYKPHFENEKRIGYSTSGGLTSHFTYYGGKKHGLTEILERNEINLTWYVNKKPKRIDIDKITNPKLKKFLPYIKENRIKFYLHNQDQQDFYVVTAMSFDDDLMQYSFNTGGGIDSDIEKAILSSLEEYVQSINNTRKIVYAPKWITSQFSNYVLAVDPSDDPKNFRTFYQAVSYYGLKEHKEKMNWYVKENKLIKLSKLIKTKNEKNIEVFLKKNKIEPIYFPYKISKRFKNIYISKVYMTEYTPAFIAGQPMLGHYKYREHLVEGTLYRKDILPYP